MARDEQGFLERCAEARRIAFSFSDPLIVHHYDADGISSGSLVMSAFRKEGRKVRSECIKKLDDTAIERYLGAGNGKRESEIIFVDLGGGNKRVNELQDVVIIDHHQTEGIGKPQANPLLSGLDGGTELSAASTAYCVFRTDADLAVVGAVGDMQHPLSGMNRWVLGQGEGSGEVKVEDDLRFYGRYCRPLVQFLAYCDEPFLPGITYREDKAVELLSELGIPLESGDRGPAAGMRVYADLDADEKKRLVSALARITMASDGSRLIGESYVFPGRPRNETYEANEFSTLLNACGRHSKPEVGVRVCLRDEGAYSEARALLSLHRKMLREGVAFAASNLQDLGPFYFLDARGVIEEGIIGVVCGMCMRQEWRKPVLGVSLGDSGTLKFSGRAPRALVESGLNLGALMKSATEELGGAGGGHRMAAGASIPEEKLEGFLLLAGSFVQNRSAGSKV
ncbi:MAG: DHH family phosphoesterase [Candidatus Micrarchaeota archaeon]